MTASSMLIPRQRIARSFGRAVRSYDKCAELQRRTALRLLGHLQQQIPDDQDVSRILDAGCGTGFCTHALHERYSQAAIVALDLAEPMIQAAMERVTGIIPLCADIQQLPFQSNAFDLIVSSLTIQWCSELPALFAELYRVSRPGARVLLSTFGPLTLRELRKAWASVDGHRHTSDFTAATALLQAAEHAGFGASLTKDLRIQHYASLRELAAELKGLGAHNLHPGQHNGLTAPAAFRAASAAFATHASPGLGIPVSWELFYLDLRKPHDDSQH